MLAAYREAEWQGAVQVSASEAAAAQACTAQAAVRARLPASRQRRGKRCRPGGNAGVTRGLPGSSRPEAPTWAAGGFRRSTATSAPRRSHPREAQRCGLGFRELRPLFPRSAPAPRRAAPRHHAAKPGAAPAGNAVASAPPCEMRQRI
ncbi:hypothetical protein NN561_001430 [Cricetulus griseus]